MQLGGHPFFKSFLERAKVLGNNRVVEKGRNLREDLRERWETSESPAVQRFQVRVMPQQQQQYSLHVWNQHTHQIISHCCKDRQC